MIVAINFSDEKFELNRQYNTKTAYSKGKVDKVREFAPTDIDESFKKDNANIFSYSRGAGLWIWKPYCILKALHEVNDGDYLFYCDSGAYYVNNIRFLINCMNEFNQTIMGFELPLLERQFTKKETFKLMKCHNYTRNQILASFILLKKNDSTLNFVEEWLDFMTDERIASPNHLCNDTEEFEDFVSHREDQSVFSILYHKYCLKPFRDPSQYGNRPFEYMWIPKYSYLYKKWTYNPHKLVYCSYPRILVSTRSVDPIKFKRKEFIKNILHVIGIYNENTFRLKNLH